MTDRTYGKLFVIHDMRPGNYEQDLRIQNPRGVVIRFLTIESAERYIRMMGLPRHQMLIALEA